MVKQMQIPLFIIHGTKDETIPVDAAVEMHGWNNQSELLLIENSNHNFGGKHPYTENNLTADLETAVNATIEFLRK